MIEVHILHSKPMVNMQHSSIIYVSKGTTVMKITVKLTVIR